MKLFAWGWGGGWGCWYGGWRVSKSWKDESALAINGNQLKLSRELPPNLKAFYKSLSIIPSSQPSQSFKLQVIPQTKQHSAVQNSGLKVWEYELIDDWCWLMLIDDDWWWWHKRVKPESKTREWQQRVTLESDKGEHLENMSERSNVP